MRIALALIPLSVALVTAPAAAQQVRNVEFARGTTGTTVSGTISGEQYVDYHIRLGSGQMFSVTMQGLGGSPYFNVMEPGSTGEAIFIGSNSGNRFEAETGRAGVYTIRVYQMRATGRRGEIARYSLNISARGSSGGAAGAGGNHPFHSRDALVPGTPYHATTQIRCVAEPRKPMSSCRAGVIRRATSATVHIDTPDGGERNILFRDGRAVSSDGQAQFSVTRRGEISVVRIGRYEIYEVPDVLITGG
jgi:hypothetical protein